MGVDTNGDNDPDTMHPDIRQMHEINQKIRTAFGNTDKSIQTVWGQLQADRVQFYQHKKTVGKQICFLYLMLPLMLFPMVIGAMDDEYSANAVRVSFALSLFPSLLMLYVYVCCPP